jgi:hypothetical protein
MEVAVVDELRRAIPAFVGLCARGKSVKEGLYNKGKRVGGKGGLGSDENHGFELKTELQCRRRWRNPARNPTIFRRYFLGFWGIYRTKIRSKSQRKWQKNPVRIGFTECYTRRKSPGGRRY